MRGPAAGVLGKSGKLTWAEVSFAAINPIGVIEILLAFSPVLKAQAPITRPRCTSAEDAFYKMDREREQELSTACGLSL